MRAFGFSSALTAAILVGHLTAPTGADAAQLESELQMLVDTHPQILATAKGITASEEDINRNRATFLPTVRLTGDYGYEHVNSPSTRSGGGSSGIGRPQTTAGVSVIQNIFDGFGRSARTTRSEINKNISEVRRENTIQNVMYEAISAYLDVLRQNRLVQLASDNEHTIQQQLSLEDERVAQGSGIAVDVLLAKSRLQISKERRISFEGALEDAVASYAQVFGKMPDIAMMSDPTPPLSLVPPTLEEAIAISQQESRPILDGELAIKVASEEKRAARSGYYPSVDLVGSANYEKHNAGVIGTRRDYSAVVRANWDIYAGGVTAASERQAAAEMGAAQNRLDHTRRKTEERVRLAWQAMNTSRRRVELLENAVNIAAEVFESRKNLREAGKETVINVLDAENEIYNAQINYTAATYNAKRAVYQLLLAMGRLTLTNVAQR